MTNAEFILRLAAATVAGLLVGFERQWRNKSAGLRTNGLVATGSALYVLLSLQITQPGGDVTRIIGQVVTGVGFLGAGIIFKEGINIHGLTTAATIWCSSAVGCLAASGYFVQTLIGTIVIIGINAALIPLDAWLSRRNSGNNRE